MAETVERQRLFLIQKFKVEEDLSRAAKLRRKELEKLMKSIKTREPERRCFLTYDRLVVDDNVYIFNEMEGRVEKLPHKVNLSSSNMDLTTITDAYNDVEYNFRYTIILLLLDSTKLCLHYHPRAAGSTHFLFGWQSKNKTT